MPRFGKIPFLLIQILLLLPKILLRQIKLKIIISFFYKIFDILFVIFFCSYFQIEIISLLSVDHDDVTLRNSSQNTLKNLLLQLENDKKNDVHSGPPMWVVDLAQSKIFETSKLLCDSGYIENLFHESKTLEKHLATVHGFLWLLKSIERAR